ncbi:MAG: zinc-dependent metalloprotease, partial [Gemmatimonadota bacterium]
YIAQPEDGLQPLDFLRHVGPYDHYSVNWGYRVIPDAATPGDERAVLDRWIVDRADDPMYRYLPQGGLGVSDPRAQTEDMGNDPVLASSYGMENLRHIVPNLVAWTTRPGEDYSDLREVYGEALTQWNRYVGHVLNVVGGVHVDLKTADQDGPVYDGLPRARQEEAMDWLAREAFEAPTWLNDPRILELIGPEPAGLRALSNRQASILNRLLDPQRMAILSELEAEDPDPYPLADFLDDTRDAIWGDVAGGAPVDAYRRALQRAYLERMAWLMSDDAEEGPSSDDADLTRLDVRPLARAQLTALRSDAEQGAQAAEDRITEAHLMDVVARIDRILDRRAGGADR